MPLACPKCGSRYLRESRPRTAKERLQQIWFKCPLRCGDCMTRFVTSTLIFSDLFYARCPHCYVMDLNGWTGKTYEPSFWMQVRINFGARRYRCEYCRKNFVDFRRRKEAFTFKRWSKTNAAQLRADGRARVSELSSQNRGTTLVADLTQSATPPDAAGDQAASE